MHERYKERSWASVGRGYRGGEGQNFSAVPGTDEAPEASPSSEGERVGRTIEPIYAAACPVRKSRHTWRPKIPPTGRLRRQHCKPCQTLIWTDRRCQRRHSPWLGFHAKLSTQTYLLLLSRLISFGWLIKITFIANERLENCSQFLSR